MWLFRGRQDDDDDDESDYDSDEYETDEDELDSGASSDDGESSTPADGSALVEIKKSMPERTESSFEEGDEGEQEKTVSEEKSKKKKVVSEEEEEQSEQEQLEQEQLEQEHSEQEQLEQEQQSELLHESEEAADDSLDATEEESEEEEATSLAEKQSLLALAAEHDRVDILKAILTPEDREALLNHHGEFPPPLHVAISYGSTNATSCLLRMGANPAIRPLCQDKRYDGVSAWELAFGSGDDNGESSKGWLGGMLSGAEESASQTPVVKAVDMAPSKREGIRHAFTAEALRCIGSDEEERLKHLLDSGMPPSIDIGGKNLHGWCVEMGAKNCQNLTLPFEPPPQEEEMTAESTSEEPSSTDAPEPRTASVSSDPDSLAALDNRLEELEALARALSSCLDNLAEEVSVCHGLLLLGGGASALASHVRSLKVLKERQETELEQWTRDWDDAQDELAYLMQEYSGSDLSEYDIVAASKLDMNDRKKSFSMPDSPEEEEAQRRQLKAQIAASENKVSELKCTFSATKLPELTLQTPLESGTQASSLYC